VPCCTFDKRKHTKSTFKAPGATDVENILFEELGWRQMQQYQFAAFQAVVADQIGGDTLLHKPHHCSPFQGACSILVVS